MINEADALRAPERALQPDSRTLSFARMDQETRHLSPITLADQHEAVVHFALNNSVLEDVAIHFETARNLYLYAWFVFRFYPLAEQQVLGTLEFALRLRQPTFVEEYKRRHHRGQEPGLGTLLKKAINDGLVKNEAFKARLKWAQRRATERYRYEQVERMSREGITEMVMDYSNVAVTEEDLNCDWLGAFSEAIPYIRNTYAHGSAMLYHSVLHSFEVVTELINQLYPEADKPPPQADVQPPI